MKVGTVVALVVGGVLALSVGGYALDRAWTYYFGAEIDGKVQAEKQIESAPSRIANYNHYYDMCASVQSLQISLKQTRKSLETAESAEERERLRANINGLVAQLGRAANQYNADARKEYTKARFKASDLPARLPRQFEEGDEVVSCEKY